MRFNYGRAVVLTASLIIAAFFCTYTAAGDGPEKGDFKGEIDGYDSYYLAFVPADYTPEKKYSLFVFLHGAGGAPEKYLPAWKKAFAGKDTIILAPKSTKPMVWDMGNFDWVVACTNEIRDKYSVGPKRVYIGGHSLGASLAYRTALNNPGLYSGIVVFAGMLTDGAAVLEKAKHQGVYIVVGENDKSFSVALQEANQKTLLDAGFEDVVLRVVEGAGHEFIVSELPRVVEWLGKAPESPLFTFAHLTDPHCVTTDKNARKRPEGEPFTVLGLKAEHWKDLIHSYEILDGTVDYLNKEIKPDFVVITGDLTDLGRPLADMAKVKASFDRLKCPYYPVMGDHDLGKSRAEFEKDRNDNNYVKVFGKRRYSFDFGGWHFAIVGIYPDDSEIEWLQRDLAANRTKPSVFCTHRLVVCPDIIQRAAKDSIGVELMMPKAGEVKKIIVENPSVVLVLSGHCHINLDLRERGTDAAFISTEALGEISHEFRFFKVYEKRVEMEMYRGWTIEKIREAGWTKRDTGASDFLAKALAGVRERALALRKEARERYEAAVKKLDGYPYEVFAALEELKAVAEEYSDLEVGAEAEKVLADFEKDPRLAAAKKKLKFEEKARKYYEKAEDYYESRKLADAVLSYRKTIDVGETSFKKKAEERLAALKADAARWEEIERELRKRECGRRLSLAKTYISSGLFEKAREILRRVIKEYPGTVYALEAQELLDEIKDR